MRLKGHATELHAHTPMPEDPRAQRHEGPRDGDNEGAAHRAAGGAFDNNVTYCAKIRDRVDGKLGTNLAAHWPYPWLNGYRYWRGPDGEGPRVRVPVRRRHWTYDRWGERYDELTRANGEHTLTLRRMLKVCADAGALPVKETKSRAFAKSDRPWHLLRRDCEWADVPMWCKALTTMFGFKSKVIRAARAGVPLAAIYGSGVRGRARRLARSRRLERGWRDGTRVYATW